MKQRSRLHRFEISIPAERKILRRLVFNHRANSITAASRGWVQGRTNSAPAHQHQILLHRKVISRNRGRSQRSLQPHIQKSGASDEIRTRDLFFTKEVLCP